LIADGSYRDIDNKSTWAFIITKREKRLCEKSGQLDGDICTIGNIGGELTAVMNGITWIKENIKVPVKVEIVHDLIGVSKWATGEWKRKNRWTKEYYKFMAENMGLIEKFTWVRSKSGDKWNTAADKLAKNELDG